MELLRTVVLFFAYPDPKNGFELLILAIVYFSLISYLFLMVSGALRLFKLTFFETFVASKSRPFSVPNSKGEKRILILGDSTAVGAGASKPEDTIAGRLAHDFPRADIVNLGINGALTKDVLRSATTLSSHQFQLTILSVGGNDIWHFTKLDELERDLRALLRITKAVTEGPTVLLVYNNIGSSPIFPFFMRSYLKKRGEEVHTLFRKIAVEEGAYSIELFSKDEGNQFLDDPERFFSHDGVHPSSEGYRLWYYRMWRLLVARGYVF